MTEIRDLPVFICGHPKSGTSLLRGILDSHPQLVAYPEETGFFRRYLPAAQGRSLDAQLELSDRFLTHIFEWSKSTPPRHQAAFLDRDYSYVPIDALRETQRRLVGERFQHDGDMLSAAILAYGEATGRLSADTRHWVEKTPYNEHYATQIYEWWPEARCVHMVRDPRDNFVSYRRKHPEWEAAEFARSWRDSSRAGLANEIRYGAERYLVIRYEDCTRDPEGMIARLCGFLGIDDDPAMRTPTRGGKTWMGNSMFTDRFEAISDAPVGRWRDSLAADDRFTLETLDASCMKLLGYERSRMNPGAVPLSLRLRTYKIMVQITLKEKFG